MRLPAFALALAVVACGPGGSTPSKRTFAGPFSYDSAWDQVGTRCEYHSATSLSGTATCTVTDNDFFNNVKCDATGTGSYTQTERLLTDPTLHYTTVRSAAVMLFGFEATESARTFQGSFTGTVGITSENGTQDWSISVTIPNSPYDPASPAFVVDETETGMTTGAQVCQQESGPFSRRTAINLVELK